MAAERALKLETLFASVVELKPAERTAFLDAACADDSELRVEVESLLEADERADRFIEKPLLEMMADAQASESGGLDESQPEPDVERRIGPYKTIRRIGAGGMGEVYLAARADDQFQQMVAIKVIRRGMDTEEIIRRFKHERQILAGLNHPNIARLLDGGATEDDLPWFALEYVEGQPLIEYCKEQRLSIDDRLRLFLTVCAAVQHAHQNLIIHRDLKPSNILVTADAAPKLLDFGIAKILDPEHHEQTVDQTLTFMRLMTPAYASPEQARGEQITTASDVYSLGMILYELLSGHRPYQVTGQMPESEIKRAICEQEPVKPSLAAAQGEQASVKFARLLRGDLDKIVLMALEKEPARRYSSVDQLAEDIRRHLNRQPVKARPATLAYRAAKLLRRNKASAAVAALATIGLLAGIIFALSQARIANQQAAIAQQERDNARHINEFLRTTLSYANPVAGSPGHGKGPDVKLVDAIKEAEKRIDKELREQPEIRGELHYTLGLIWKQRGEYASAEPHIRAALELFRQLYGERHPRAIQSLNTLGYLVGHKGDHAAAVTMMQQSVELMRRSDSQNETFPRMLLDLGERLSWGGHYSEAESLILEARQAYRKTLGTEDDYRVAYTFCRLGNLYKVNGELELAQAAYHEFLERLRRLPVKHEAGEALYNLGVIDYTRGNYQEAERSLNEANKLFSEYLGENFPQIAEFLYYLASIHCLQKDYARAEAEARRALEIRQQKHGPDHPWTIVSLGLLSKVLISAGRPDRAAPYLREAMEKYRVAPDENKWHQMAGILGECLTLLKRYEEAERLLNENCATHQCDCGGKSPEDVEMRRRLVKLYEVWGKPEQAARFR